MPGWERLCMRSKIVVRNEFKIMGRNFPVLVSPSVATDDAPSCEVPSRRRTIKPLAWQKDYYMF